MFLPAEIEAPVREALAVQGRLHRTETDIETGQNPAMFALTVLGPVVMRADGQALPLRTRWTSPAPAPCTTSTTPPCPVIACA